MGYRMPAEWEPHVATWLTWPRREGISFPGKYDPVPNVYAALIGALAGREEVHINVWDEAAGQEVRALLTSIDTPLDHVTFHPFPAYEPWCRDHGPIFVVGEGAPGRHPRAVVDWGYNAWGGKYPPFDLDDAVPQHVARWRKLPLFAPAMILEGGSIEVNGQGTLLTTGSCLLNPNRNPDLSQAAIEAFLRDYLGVCHFLWLSEGIEGDDTDGHIDNLARFVGPNTLAAPLEENPVDPNHEPLRRNWSELEAMRDPLGQPYRLVPLPMPGRIEHEGQRLPASYMNFYIANGVVLLPTYRHASDEVARRALQDAFPDREVLGIDAVDLIWGLGSFHCITQQEPA